MSILSTLAQSMQYDQSAYDDSSSLYGNDPSYYSHAGGVTPADTAAAAAATFALLGFFAIVAVASYVISAFLLGRIFKKAGVEQWKAWVPVYNTWVLLELGDQKGFWAILMLVPVVNIVALVFMIIAQYHIGLKLGKEGPFVLLAIFIPIVWLIWLAFDKSTWKGAVPAGVPATSSTPTAPPAPTTEQHPPTTPPTVE